MNSTMIKVKFLIKSGSPLMKSLDVIIVIVMMAFTTSLFAQVDDFPINREPGKCYGKCMIPDQYQTVTEQVLVKAASSRIETVPAKYETVTEKVMTKEASFGVKRIPAEYETVAREYYVGCPEGFHEDVTITGGSGEGACIKFITKPAQYETVTEKILVKEASTRLEVVPAEYETISEKVMVKPASFRTEIIPPQYETVTEQALDKEAASQIIRVPAEYREQTERIEIKPATTQWVRKRADKNCLSEDPNDCLVWGLVEVPAEYRNITKRVRVGCPEGFTDSGDDCIKLEEVPAEFSTRNYRKLKAAGATQQVEVPAEYKTITRRVLKRPATTRVIEVPAEYSTHTIQKLVRAASVDVVRQPKIIDTYLEKVRKPCPEGWAIDNSGGVGNNGDCIRMAEVPAEFATRDVRKLVTPATTRTIEVPAEYTTVTKRLLVKKGGFTEWREVLCSESVTPNIILQIQRALQERGYDAGAIDGVLGSLTKTALIQYQNDKGLPIGQMDMRTLQQLGVSF